MKNLSLQVPRGACNDRLFFAQKKDLMTEIIARRQFAPLYI